MPQKNTQTSFQYGGQAVIEGVTMRGPRDVATGVRGGDEIVIHQEKYTPGRILFSFEVAIYSGYCCAY